MNNKLKGLIFYSKKIKDNDLFIKILSSNNEINSGIVYGGNSSKKKMIFQNGYFIDYSIIIKNQSIPPIISGDITKPFLANLINNKYKLNALISILSLINVSILEGQNIKGFYKSVENLILNIINQNHWIIYYCEWLFLLLRLIGYEIDYKKNDNNKFFNIKNHDFQNYADKDTIEFPHILFKTHTNVCFKYINSVFLIFESIFIKNHLDNINYKMPLTYLNFKKLILKELN